MQVPKYVRMYSLVEACTVCTSQSISISTPKNVLSVISKLSILNEKHLDMRFCTESKQKEVLLWVADMILQCAVRQASEHPCMEWRSLAALTYPKVSPLHGYHMLPSKI